MKTPETLNRIMNPQIFEFLRSASDSVSFAVVLHFLGLSWLATVLLAAMALKKLFMFVGDAAPEASKMVEAWKKAAKEIKGRRD